MMNMKKGPVHFHFFFFYIVNKMKIRQLGELNSSTDFLSNPEEGIAR